MAKGKMFSGCSVYIKKNITHTKEVKLRREEGAFCIEKNNVGFIK